MDYEKILSKRVQELKPSGIRKFFDIAANMKDVISLSIGEPDFKTPWEVRAAAIETLEKGRTTYTANSGLAALRVEIARYMERKFGLSYHPEDETLVTVGGSEAIDLCIRAFVEPGDEVLVVEPCFVAYAPIIEMMRGVPVPVKTVAEEGFRLTPARLRRKNHRKNKAARFAISKQSDRRRYAPKSISRQLQRCSAARTSWCCRTKSTPS